MMSFAYQQAGALHGAIVQIRIHQRLQMKIDNHANCNREVSLAMCLWSKPQTANRMKNDALSGRF
jgi:hypothetical protein